MFALWSSLTSFNARSFKGRREISGATARGLSGKPAALVSKASGRSLFLRLLLLHLFQFLLQQHLFLRLG